ncbi:glutaredoxin family protein [Alkalicoccobacillus murimartini]|uniref:Glutaredoxin n=1 Tax=Alkalicoccobacillus murimartini TaxID=171685 RepID=A0ABT9YFC3_9BACI|nr:glutaredoxin [Alkalicoccobacillus murimartini]MDQ0206542.1 glutaredoxin [Alkalicoccobacillus murimartini]
MSEIQSVIVWSKEGCHYCAEVKDFLHEKSIPYQTIDVTNHDERRDILDIKYGVRHVPVVEIGEGHTYKGITKVGLEYLKEALQVEETPS